MFHSNFCNQNIAEVGTLPAIYAVSSKGYTPWGIQLLPNLQGLRMNNRGMFSSLAPDTPERYMVALLTCAAGLFEYTVLGG